VVVTFLNRLAAGESPVIDGRGEQSMDFVYVTDVARAVGMAVDSEATGELLNVGTGRQTTIADLADLLIRSVGADVQPLFRPREVLVARREASIDRIAEVLGWQPTIELEQGLASVVEWLKQTSTAA
jgi:UDP-glucose 4-epimerase